jgi:predicted enzyme related to lactoylglutathione lyase
MTRPLVHFEIRGRDPDGLKEFYREIFGWKISDSQFGYAFIEGGVGGPPEVGGAITRDDEPRIVIFVQVLDLLETLAKAESLGGKRIMEPLDVPGGPTIARMADPEGNVIGLVKQ